MSVVGALGLGLIFWGAFESPTFNGLDMAGWVLLSAGVLATVLRSLVSR